MTCTETVPVVHHVEQLFYVMFSMNVMHKTLQVTPLGITTTCAHQCPLSERSIGPSCHVRRKVGLQKLHCVMSSIHRIATLHTFLPLHDRYQPFTDANAVKAATVLAHAALYLIARTSCSHKVGQAPTSRMPDKDWILPFCQLELRPLQPH